MDDLSDRLSRLGEAVAGADGPDRDAIADARRRFVRGEPSRRAVVRRRRRTVVLAAAAAALFAAGGVALSRTATGATGREPAAVVSYRAGEVEGGAGQWFAAGEEALPVRFSEGTRIEVQPEARVRVSDLRARGASVDVERGHIEARVTHAPGADWLFRAGPYGVRVTGTRFALRWDAASEHLEVRMLEGSVEVSGPMLERPQAVVAGQTLQAWVGEERVEIRRGAREDEEAELFAPPGSSAQARPVGAGASAAGPAPSVSPAGASAAAIPAEPASATPQTAPTARAEARDPEWRRALADGSHAEALAAAERAGFARVLRSAEPRELYRLADAARLTGRPERAREALVTLRTGHHERGRSAFLLGRIAADAGDRAEAVRWLRTYLREDPDGPLAEPALGRLIELDATNARDLAEQYLARFPSGAYAELARSVSSPR